MSDVQDEFAMLLHFIWVKAYRNDTALLTHAQYTVAILCTLRHTGPTVSCVLLPLAGTIRRHPAHQHPVNPLVPIAIYVFYKLTAIFPELIVVFL